MSVWYYIRVSHRASAESGLSVQAQLERCRRYHQDKLPGVPMAEYLQIDGQPGIMIDNGVSAFKKKLHQRYGGHILASCVEPGDHVLFYSVDRGFRNLADWATTMEKWRAEGIKPHFISENIDTSTANGEAMADYLAVAAKHYSRIIGERVKEAFLIAKLKKRGAIKDDEKKAAVGDSEWIFKANSKPKKADSGYVYIYERCSHEDSYTSGLGLEAQAAANTAYAKTLIQNSPNLFLGEKLVDEAVSAYKVDFAKRPQGKLLMSKLKRGDHIVVYRVDRAWRNIKDALLMMADLKEKGVTIHFSRDNIDCSSAFGESWVAMMAFAAKMESDIKSVRSREVNDICRAKGRLLGEAPAGFKAAVVDGVKKLTIDHERMVKLATVWVLLREWGYRKIDVMNIVAAMYYRDNKKHPQKVKLRFGYVKEYRMQCEFKRADRAHAALPEAAWKSFCDKAKEKLAEPVPEKYMLHCPIPQPWGPVVSDATSPPPQVNSESHLSF